MSVPGNLIASALAATPPTLSELKRYASGVIAHAAIQTAYRLQHRGNLVIAERSVWVGDTSSSTISHFLKVVDTVKDNAGKTLSAADILGGGPRGGDLLSFLLYVLDDSTAEIQPGGKGLLSRIFRKRYDIIDFGPIAGVKPIAAAAGIASGVLFGSAYEIKSSDAKELQKGADYIKRQVSRFNQAMQTYGPTVAGALGIKGIDAYVVKPGSWPPTPQVLWLGPGNILRYWRSEAPGVIAYKWQKFNSKSLEKMWALYYSIVRLVKESLRRNPQTQSLRPQTVAIAATLAVFAAVFAGIVIAGIAKLAAGSLIARAVGNALGGAVASGVRALSGSSAVGIMLNAQMAGAATPTSSPPDAGSSQADATLFEFLTTPNRLDETSRAGGRQPRGASVSAGASLSGGTPATADETFVDDVSRTIVEEMLFRFFVARGQGDENLDDETMRIIRDESRLAVAASVEKVGADELRKMCGVAAAAPDAGRVVGLAIAQATAEAFDSAGGLTFFGELLDLPDRAFAASVPPFTNDDGEDDPNGG